MFGLGIFVFGSTAFVWASDDHPNPTDATNPMREKIRRLYAAVGQEAFVKYTERNRDLLRLLLPDLYHHDVQSARRLDQTVTNPSGDVWDLSPEVIEIMTSTTDPP